MDKVSILIIGDFVLDETWYVNVVRLNPEAPVPTAELTGLQPYREPGGAGFAATWAASQGLDVSLISFVAKDNIPRLGKYGIKTYSPWNNCNINVTKTRYIDYNSGYHLIRLDNDRLVADPNTSLDSVIQTIEEVIKCNRIDVCLLSDYCKGFFHDRVQWYHVLDHLRSNEIPTILDTRASYAQLWASDDMSIKYPWVKLNDREFGRIIKSLDWSFCHDDPELTVKNEVFSRLLITHGKGGAHAYEAIWPDVPKEEEGPDVSIVQYVADTNRSQIPDPTGCGDIFDVAFISSIGTGRTTKDALKYAVDTATRFAYIPLKDKFNG